MPHAIVNGTSGREKEIAEADAAVRSGTAGRCAIRNLAASTLAALALSAGVAAAPPPERELTLTGSCGAVDLGEGLVMTAWHCRAMLPDGARVLVRGAVGSGAATGPMDYVVALVPPAGRPRPLACRADATWGLWRGRETRF